MKKRIATWLVGIAKRLDPQKDIETKEHYTARTLGVCYHISKSDVRKYRARHPEYASHRKALNALVNDTREIVLGSIAAGIRDKGLVEYEIHKTLWTADVAGTLNVYAKGEDEKANES